MDEKELAKLNRKDLLTLLLDAAKKNEELTDKLDELQRIVDEREETASNYSSIAEASLQLNDVFKSASAAAELYLSNVKVQEDVQLDLKRQAEDHLKEAQQQCLELEEESKKKCADMEAASSQKCSDMLASATKEADDYRSQVNAKIDKLRQNYENIFNMMQNLQSGFDTK